MTARTGMANPISDLRKMSNAGTADYSIAGSAFWSDDQLQTILDGNREDFCFHEMSVIPRVASGGVYQYFDYKLPFTNIEAGTAAFSIQDNNGGTVAASNYTLDDRRGVVTFNADTAGALYFANGHTFDMNAAAAEVWDEKAAYYADQFTFSTDNHSVQAGKLVENAQKMAQKFRAQSKSAVNVIRTYRGDQC